MNVLRVAPGALTIVLLGLGVPLVGDLLPRAAAHGPRHHDEDSAPRADRGARGARQVGLGDARAPELHAPLPPEVVRLRREVADALDGHDFRAAAAGARRLLERDPADRWANQVLSDAMVELGDLEAAKDALQRVLDVKPTGAAYLRAGYLLHLQGDTPGAVEAFRLACEALPAADRASRGWAHAELGHLLWSIGDATGAAREYDAALAIDRRQEEARVGRARVLAARGDLHAAAHELEHAARSPEHLGELAVLQEELGWREEAAETVERAERLLDEDRLWARSMALCLADTARDAARAVALAREEVERRPSAHSHDALAWALVRDGRPAEALAEAERALATGVEEPLLLFHAGMAASAAGDAARARRWLARALELNPTFHVRFARLARRTLEDLQIRIAVKESVR